jgi:hypothetical protein
VSPLVRYADAEPNGLADLLGRLLEANVEADPARRRLLAPAVIEVDASDAAVAARVELTPDAVVVANLWTSGAAASADVRIRAGAADLLALAGAPLLAGLPSPFRRDGRDVLRRIANGSVRISGMLRHPVVVSRFARLLSVS